MAKKPKVEEFYVRADFQGFTEGPLSEADLIEYVSSGDVKRSGKISLDGDNFISIQRVEDLLWPTSLPKLKPGEEPESLYEQIYYRINPGKRRKKKLRVNKSLGTLLKQMLKWYKTPKEEREKISFGDVIQSHKRQFITLCGLGLSILVVIGIVLVLFPVLAYHSRFEKGSAALNSGDFNGAMNFFREALQVRGYANDAAAKEGIGAAKYQLEHKKAKDSYAKLMREGKDAFADKNFALAKEKYQAAMALPSFTSDIPAREELAKTEDELKVQNAENEKLRKQYDRIMRLADLAFQAEKYQRAEDLSNDALRLPGFEADAAALKRIEKARAARDAGQQKNQERFDQLVREGDYFLSSGNYTRSRETFERAMEIPGFDGHAKAKDGIARIQQALAAAAEMFPFLEQNGEAKITDYKGKENSLAVPDKLADLPVTVIAAKAFTDKKLAKLSLPATMKYIGDSAFANNQITSVELPATLATIGESAFANNKLSIVVIANGVQTIGAFAFANNLLTDVSLPTSMTKVEPFAFANNKLTKVKISDETTNVSPAAFYGNPQLAITFPDGNVFKSDANYEIYERGSEQPRRSTLIKYDGQKGGGLKISAKVGNFPFNEIGARAFEDGGYTQVSIPKAVKKIGAKAFAGCPLTQIELGAQAAIAADAFDDPEFIELYNQKKSSGVFVRENGVWKKRLSADGQ